MTAHKPLFAVVKADAYGHGAVEVARTLVAQGVDVLAVAFAEEAKLLRHSGIATKVLVLFDQTDISACFDLNLTPVLHDKKAAIAFSREARTRHTTMPVHLKVDTGMGRMGLQAASAAADALEIDALEGIVLEGLLSHFAEADLIDRSFASHQLTRFRALRADIERHTGRNLLCHMANSAAIFSFPDSLLDAVRPGLALYGYSSLEGQFGLKPVMTVKARIIAVRALSAGTSVSYGRTYVTKRDSRIAVLALGYADGYHRLLSNNAEVLVNGCRVPVVGRICMDLTMIDVTDAGNVAEGDEAVILGAQNGEVITATELSGRVGTIPYEILTSLGNRSRREYVN
jgi:alanine racemase